MNHRPAASTKARPHRRDRLGLALLILLITFLSAPPIAAGTSGAVSVSIRLEVGIADLQRGGNSEGSNGPTGTTRPFGELTQQLRSSLEGRYQPSEIDRIVGDVTDDAVIVVDGQPIGRRASDCAFVHTRDGSAFSL